MKNSSTAFVSIVFLCFLSFLDTKAFAQGTREKKESAFYADFYVMQVKPMKFQVTYNWPVTDRVLIRITDGNKNLLFTEKALVYKKYEKLFDLSTFRDGQYTFELFDGEYEFNQSFEVNTITKREVTARTSKSAPFSEL